jgi:DNA-binding NarL/FixJ family response regulator
MAIRTLVAATPPCRERVTSLLGAAGGYTVVAEADDGLSAVRLAQEHQPDLVVLGADLPQLGGIEATAPIRSRSPRSTIVVLTGQAGGRLALRAGADRSVTLDSPDPEIIEAVRSSLPAELRCGRTAG